MMRRIAHQTSGEAKPLSPVQDHALSVSATSVAPRFKSNSDTSTQATLRTSCSQGLPKPEGRFCIRFSTARSNRCNQFSISVVASLCKARPQCSQHLVRWTAQRSCLQNTRLSELVGVWKALQNRIVARRTQIFDQAAKDWIEQGICVQHVQIERH